MVQLRRKLSKDRCIAAKQLESRFAGFLPYPGGDDDHLGLNQVGVASGTNASTTDVPLAVHEVHGLPFGPFFVKINENELIYRALLEHGVRRCHSHMSGANNANRVSL
jgi:hypothetical protein